MQARAQRPGAKVLSAEMWPADEPTAEWLRVKLGQPVYRLRRLRLADSEPLAIETSCISFIGCERLLGHDLERDSLYQLLDATYDVPPLEAEQEFEADLAGDEEATLLKIVIGSPILRTRRITMTRRNQPVEFATSVYRGDKYRFVTRMVRDHR